MPALSPRLLAIVDALPLRDGLHILEIGCGPGAMAREMVRRVGTGRVLGIDRSAVAIAQATSSGAAEIALGRLLFRCVSGEDFHLEPGDQPFDLAVAIRVGALDGRHPEAGVLMRAAIARALKPGAKLFIDGGDPLRAVTLL